MGNEVLKEIKGEYIDIKVPEQGLAEVQKRIADAKRDKRMHKRQKRVRCFGTAAAAALVLFILPNTNAGIAHAMGDIPLLGHFFQVITIREYHYEDETHVITAQIAEVQSDDAVLQDSIDVLSIRETQETIRALNEIITAYVDVLMKEFEADMLEGGYQSLEIDYTTVTDTDSSFTLAIYAFETEASGYEFRRYYHIDKTTGKTADIMSLLQDEEGLQAVSEEILSQMQRQMEEKEAFYFLKSEGDPTGFEAISREQNFYFNEEGKLVIVFDEYEVAPGSAGCPEFVIPDEVWKAE